MQAGIRRPLLFITILIFLAELGRLVLAAFSHRPNRMQEMGIGDDWPATGFAAERTQVVVTM